MELEGIDELNEDQVFPLWRNATNNKEQLQAVLVRLLQRHAHAICWQRLGQHRPDIVNEAVWYVLTKGDTFRGEAKFSTWFQKIVLNMCCMTLREKIHNAEVPLDTVPELSTNVLPDARLAVQGLMKGLTERQQRITQLKLEGLEDQEIATEMGATKKGIESSWARIRRRLTKTVQRGRGDEVGE